MEPLPPWLSSKIRRAALLDALSWIPSLGAILLLLACVDGLWITGNVESVFVPLFWNALFLTGLFFLLKGFAAPARLYFHPERSEEAAALARKGSLAALTGQIEVELRDPGVFVRGEAALTRNWLVVSGGGRFALRRLDGLVWAYVEKKTTLLNAVLPIWRSYSAVFRFDQDPEARAAASQKLSLELLEEVSKRCPSAIMGYKDELAKLWAADRAAFAAEVMKRRT